MSQRQTNSLLDKIYQRYNEFEGAPVHINKNKFSVDDSIRSNTVLALREDDPIYLNIDRAMNVGIDIYKQRLVDVHSSYNAYPFDGAYATRMSREDIQVLKYEPGQRYKWHTDQFSDIEHRLHLRSISLVLYLTNNFTGGRTCLPHKCYKPRPGQALIFPSNWCFPHSAEPVKSGTKIACVGWYHSHYIE